MYRKNPDRFCARVPNEREKTSLPERAERPGQPFCGLLHYVWWRIPALQCMNWARGSVSSTPSCYCGLAGRLGLVRSRLLRTFARSLLDLNPPPALLVLRHR